MMSVNFTLAKQLLFKFIKFYISVFCRKPCKIDKIEQNHYGYIVTFVYVSKRQPFVKQISEIMKNDYLLNEFEPIEAALLGFYYYLSRHEESSKQILSHLQL